MPPSSSWQENRGKTGVTYKHVEKDFKSEVKVTEKEIAEQWVETSAAASIYNYILPHSNIYYI